MEQNTNTQNKTYLGIILMISAAVCTSFGQLFWKLSEANLNIELIFGFFLYFFGAVLMIVAFRFGKLSILHPLLSIGYVFSTLLGSFFLNEVISISSIMGIIFIMSGVILIGGETN
ncbi:EamA/RhaT family transporter [Bacillus marasmi]|uniref:EamA/RhaT family transporter n=1 Tax=Bacillus marasmi TaxID=1926279 RepID=UPI0011C85465|nr:EamA/RhaT family transporter [Bacillus marasmi]